MSKALPTAPVQLEIFVYTNGAALPVIARVAEALFADSGTWTGRAVGKMSEHRVSRLRGVKAAFEKLSLAFDGSLNAIHQQGRFSAPHTHPLFEAVDVHVELSPRASDWAAIDADDPEFWRLKRNLRRELLSLESSQGYVTHRKIVRDPSYLRIGIKPTTASVTTDLLRAFARPVAKQFSLEQAAGFIGYVDTLETCGDPRGRLRPQPDKSTRMDTYFDAAHRVTVGAAHLLEQYAKDVAIAFPNAPQSLEVFGGAAMHSFETWESVWKIFLPVWHDGKVS